MQAQRFDDGSSVEWFSRESLLYRSGAYAVQIAYDYGHDDLFKQDRKILRNSVVKWEKFPRSASPFISPEERENILRRAVEYFSRQGMSAEVVDN